LSWSEATTKIEILKQEKKMVTLAGGSFEVESAIVEVDFGEKCLMSMTAIGGRWLHYEVHHSTVEADVEKFWADRLLREQKAKWNK
jgi:hypothetical protein